MRTQIRRIKSKNNKKYLATYLSWTDSEKINFLMGAFLRFAIGQHRVNKVLDRKPFYKQLFLYVSTAFVERV